MLNLNHPNRQHIIATALTPKKRDEFRTYKVVTPSWLIDSVAAGRLLNWSDYILKNAVSNTPARLIASEVTGGIRTAQLTLFPAANKVTHTNNITQASIQDTQRRAVVPSPGTSTCELKSTLLTTAVQDKVKSRHIPPPPPTLPPSSCPLPPENIPTAGSLTFQQVSGVSSKTASRPDLHPDAQHDSNAPNFIQGYFKQSRLHHLSTWKAELLQQVATLTEQSKIGKHKPSPVRKLKGDETDGRVIMHVDFDCFFISAGLINRPDLRGKPVAVCHAQNNPSTVLKSTSEIASCSYEARAFGVKNGQMRVTSKM